MNGYPIFKEPHLRQSVNIGKQKGNHTTDYTNAIGGSKLDPPKIDGTTWHHHEDGMTMQEFNSDIHDRFTHRGGVSKVKKAGRFIFTDCVVFFFLFFHAKDKTL